MRTSHSTENKKVVGQEEHKLIPHKGILMTEAQYERVRAAELAEQEHAEQYRSVEADVSKPTEKNEEAAKEILESEKRREELLALELEDLKEIYKKEVGKNVPIKYKNDKQYQVNRILSPN